MTQARLALCHQIVRGNDPGTSRLVSPDSAVRGNDPDTSRLVPHVVAA